MKYVVDRTEQLVRSAMGRVRLAAGGGSVSTGPWTALVSAENKNELSYVLTCVT